jgi:uncharacterized membrane protein (UPF0127 family)
MPPSPRRFLSLALLLSLAPLASVAAPAPPQFLPVSAQWCLSGGCLDLEVPKTQEQYRRGLIQRPALGPWRGMWFRFSPAQSVGFWMHQCLVPLDLVFLRDGKVVEIKAQLPACPRLPCPSYKASEAVDGVVELQAGRAAELGLTVGSAAVIP